MHKDKDALAGELLGQGTESARAGDWNAAEGYYRQALELEPDHRSIRYFAHNDLAFCLIRLGRLVEAQIYCEAAILIDGRRHDAHKNLGLARLGLGHFAEAAECFLEAGRLGPADPRAGQHLRNLLRDHPEVRHESPALCQNLHQLTQGCRSEVEVAS
jgi:Flp pilus assembly protein TadD